MLENLNKPVVLTGSMLPMFHIQTDARRNLAVALMIGAYSQVTEVCILFGRCVKLTQLFVWSFFLAVYCEATDLENWIARKWTHLKVPISQCWVV